MMVEMIFLQRGGRIIIRDVITVLFPDRKSWFIHLQFFCECVNVCGCNDGRLNRCLPTYFI